MQVEWDEKKAISNEVKHGVTFEEAITVLGNLGTITFDSPHRSEKRLLSIGLSSVHKLLLVVFCKRDEDTIRIISARPASRKERKVYEEGI